MSLSRSLALLTIALLLAACAAPAATTRPTGGTPAAVATPTAAAVVPTALAATPSAAPATATPAGATATPAAATPEPTPSAVAAVCGPIESLPLKNAGRLTLSTDIPAFPPWWGGDPETVYPNEPAGAPVWDTSDPYSMEGYEGATAYAIAAAMGFTPDQVDWLPNANFENAFAPGDKPFDFHMAQISITEERAQAVDFTDLYFEANQALIAMTTNPTTEENPNPITLAATIEDLKNYTLGAARNTTSLDLIEDVIVPNVEHRAPTNNANALRALQNGQIDGLVVDLSTAFFMRDAQLENYDTPEPESMIVGQFSTELQADPVGAVLQLDSPLTDCINSALAQIQADGTLDAIYDEWIVSDQAVPFLE